VPIFFFKAFAPPRSSAIAATVISATWQYYLAKWRHVQAKQASRISLEVANR
jgi:hypothetical protein